MLSSKWCNKTMPGFRAYSKNWGWQRCPVAVKIRQVPYTLKDGSKAATPHANVRSRDGMIVSQDLWLALFPTRFTSKRQWRRKIIGFWKEKNNRRNVKRLLGVTEWVSQLDCHHPINIIQYSIAVLMATLKEMHFFLLFSSNRITIFSYFRCR